MAFTILPLSGSANGRPLLVVATADPGNTVHTAIAGILQIDEIILNVLNSDVADRTLTIECGSNAASDLLTWVIPFGVTISLPAFYLQNGLPLKAYASVTNKLLIWGVVHRGP